MTDPAEHARPADEARTQVVDIIDQADDLTIATVGPDGCPHATTVSYVNDGAIIWFGTSPLSRKAKNLGWCDRVSLTINLPYESWDDIRGIVLEGRATAVSDPDERRKVGTLMFAKFPQIARYVPENASADDLALFRIDGETASLLDYRTGFGHTDAVRL